MGCVSRIYWNPLLDIFAGHASHDLVDARFFQIGCADAELQVSGVGGQKQFVSGEMLQRFFGKMTNDESALPPLP